MLVLVLLISIVLGMHECGYDLIRFVLDPS